MSILSKNCSSIPSTEERGMSTSSSSSGDTKLSVLVILFKWMQRTKSSPKKRSKFRKFLHSFCDPSDYFSPIRLILPSLDRERGSYGLKESVLATCLVDALGMSRDSPDALRLFNWRRGGPRTGANAGNFSLVASEVLQLRQGSASQGLTIKELNNFLDSLASAETRSEKTNILSTLIKRTNAEEMKWIVRVILKDLKLGISEKSIFHEFHPDAEDLFNVTCDLKLVCEKLRDRGQRHKRQDIEVGKAVRPQLALRVANIAAAWKKLHGKEVVVECKFDGDRIQAHKNGTDIHFFSRSFLDHTEYRPGMSKVILDNILVDRCILDGEMLVWDNSLNRFAEFGSNQEIAKAARDGLDTDRQLCYVVFDILYAGDTSVIHQSLKERQELLLKVIRPAKGRLEVLVPDVGRTSHHPTGEPCWSMVAKSVDDLERFFKETIENRDEGVVVKDLNSKWEPGDRSGKWLKLKPDYIHPSSDLDVLIIGGYYGSGRLGGEVAQFLVGLAEQPASNMFPRRFLSFCRVGTGLTDEERNAVVTKLKPYFRKYKEPPNFYQVTNHSKERPDVWVDSPEKSVVVSITSDIRTISSEVFAAPYSLRFPRIDRVRWDKPWHDCLDVQSFIQLVHTSNGTTHGGKEYESQQIRHKRSSQTLKGERKDLSKVPSHFARTDISGIKGESKIFSNMMFYFANVPSNISLDTVHKMVVENGGSFSMNLNDLVTHCIAAESKGIKYNAAKQRRDVIHTSWFLDCCKRKNLLPLQPKHFLFISESSKRNLLEDVDEFSDSYYWDLDIADIKQLLNNMGRSESPQNIEYYMKKFQPPEKWSCFHGCRIYISSLLETLKCEWTISLRIQQMRLGLEVCWRGGEVTKDLVQATHVVVLTIPGSAVDPCSFLKSLSEAEKRLLRMKNIPLVDSNWLDSCLESDQKLPEDSYKLKINLAEESTERERALDADHGGIPLGSNTVGRQTLSSSLDEEPKRGKAVISGTMDELKIGGTRKRGRTTSGSLKRGNRGVTQTRRLLRRPGKKAAKIFQNVTGNSSPDESSDGHVEIQEDNQDHVSVSNELCNNPFHHNVGLLQQSKSGGVAELLDTDNQEDDSVDVQEMKGEKSDRTDVERPNEMEASADTVQAMLFDMIPSLGIRKLEASEGPSENKKSTAEVVEPNDEEPRKKKKVSYKDIAGELLKDW